MINKIVSWCIHHKKTVIAAYVCLFGLCIFLAKDLQMDNSNDQFWIEGEPGLVEYQNFQKNFGSEEFFLISIHGESLQSKAGLLELDDIYSDILALEIQGQKPFSEIISPLHTPAPVIADGILDFQPLITQIKSDVPIESIKEKIHSHPIFNTLLYSNDEKSAGIFASIVGGKSDEFIRELASAVDSIAGSHNSLNLSVSSVGPPALKHQIDEITGKETILFGGSALLVAILVLSILYRRLCQVMGTTMVILVSNFFVFGLISLCTGTMSMVGIILPLVLVITGLGTCVHILNAFRHFYTNKANFRKSLLEAYTSTGRACFFTSLTTAAGFISMVAVPIAPIRELGAYTAVGAMALFFSAITLLPAFLSLDPCFTNATKSKTDEKNALRFMATIALAKPKVTIAISLIMVLLISVGIFNLKIESNFGQSFKATHPHRLAIEQVDRDLAGTGSFEMLFDTKKADGVLEPDFLKKLAEFLTWVHFEQGDIIPHTVSVLSIFELLNMGLNSDDMLPKSLDESAQLLLLYELSEGSTKTLFDKNKQIAHATLFSRNLPTSIVEARELIILQKANAIFNSANHEQVKVTLTGVMPMFAELTTYIVETQLRTFVIAGLFIILFMIWVLGSIRLGIATMIPNLLPIIATYGVMGWLGYELDWLNAIIPGVSLGFAVDGTIHFGLTFKHLRKLGNTALQAAHQSVLRIGRAVTITSLTLSAGFCIFIFSDMINLARLGFLLALCFLFALLADIMLTPALLVWVDEKRVQS